MYGLKTNDGDLVALKSVEIDACIESWILTKTIRQYYRNDTQENLEVVYSFPLAYDETLLSMSVIIGSKRLEARIMERETANERYEEAIEKGDMPILVEMVSDGIAGVNLGNFSAGEEICLEIVSAVSLRFVGSQIRLTLPSTIAPRYGDEITQGGFREHYAVNADITVKYPLNIRIELKGEAANAAIFSPSHPLRVKHNGEAAMASLTDKAFLDRDFILILDEIKSVSEILIAQDGDEYAAIATFYPPISTNAKPILLKILVDCSGSMSGDSITTAKRALKRIAGELNRKDFVSYSRFGSRTVHDFKSPFPCNSEVLLALDTVIEDTSANLGGTNIEEALLEVFDFPARNGICSNVLLITDGETWDTKEIIKTAKKTAQKVFVLGIGAAAAEIFLRDLAEQSGGAYEAVSPNEDGEDAIVRMFYRMRGEELAGVKMEWFQPPLWCADMPKSIYGGETLRIFAKLKTLPSQTPILSYMQEGKPQTLNAPIIKTQDNTIARLCAARQIKQTDDVKKRLDLALNYQLLTDETALFLVNELAQKADGAPLLHQVSQQLAAGWGGYGSVTQDRLYCIPPTNGLEYIGRELHVTRQRVSQPDSSVVQKLTKVRRKLRNYIEGGNYDDEKTAKKLNAKLRKIPNKYKDMSGQRYVGVGEIIAFAYIGKIKDCDAVLLGYDAKKSALSIILPASRALLDEITKSHKLSQTVNCQKLLSDLGLPLETKITPAVLVECPKDFNKTLCPPISELIAKLGVVIVEKRVISSYIEG
jgi:Ca-activated chloride channel family protein